MHLKAESRRMVVLPARSPGEGGGGREADDVCQFTSLQFSECSGTQKGNLEIFPGDVLRMNEIILD